MSRATTVGVRATGARPSSGESKRTIAPARKTAKRTARRIVQPAPSLPVEVGRVIQVDERAVLVEVASRGPQPRTASSVVAHGDLQAGDRVVVVALAGAPAELVILGRLFDAQAPARDVRINGRKVSVEANTELVLKCASATIRIAHDGLVAVRGDRVVTQASGVNRIRGGSVEIN